MGGAFSVAQIPNDDTKAGPEATDSLPELRPVVLKAIFRTKKYRIQLILIFVYFHQAPTSDKKSISSHSNPKGSEKSDGRRKSAVVKSNQGLNKIVSWFENDDDEGKISTGDVVRVNIANGHPLEGFVVERLNDFNILVDFGENLKECHVSNCTVIIKSDELEVGDKVEMKPMGMSLYFVGKVIGINPDCTLDVLMDGDDPEDIERGVNVEDIRKLMSKRGLVVSRWRRAFMMVVAINRFGKVSFQEEAEYKDNSDHE